MVEISADSNAQLLARLKKEIYAAILPETEPIEAYQVNKFYRYCVFLYFLSIPLFCQGGMA
jgi:hypothetical protein